MNTSSNFGIGMSDVGGKRILIISGEFDMAVTAQLERALLASIAAAGPGSELVLDLSDVRFVDVTAMRALIRTMRAAQEAHVALDLIASPAVDRVFELAGVALTASDERTAQPS